MIHAHSPAAKGRIERLFQTLQDRLVKELRLAGASTWRSQPGSPTLPATLQPALPGPGSSADGSASPGAGPAGSRYGAVPESPTTAQCHSTVQHEGQVYLVEDRLKAQTVMVHQRLDGSIHLRCHNRSLSFRLVPQRPRKVQPRVKPVLPDNHRPAEEHPWRGSYKRLRPERHSRARFDRSPGVLFRHFPNSLELPGALETLMIADNPQTGHFYFGNNRTFLFWVEIRAPALDQPQLIF